MHCSPHLFRAVPEHKQVDPGPPSRARIKGLWKLRVAYHSTALESARRRGVVVNDHGCELEVTRYTHVHDIRKYVADELELPMPRVQLQAFDLDDLNESQDASAAAAGEIQDGATVENGQLFHRRVVCKVVSVSALGAPVSQWDASNMNAAAEPASKSANNSANFNRSVSLSMSQHLAAHTSDSLSDSDAFSITSQSTLAEDSLDLETSLNPSSLTHTRSQRISMEGPSERSNLSRSYMSNRSNNLSNMSNRSSRSNRSNRSNRSEGTSFNFTLSNVTSKNGNSMEYSNTAEDLPRLGDSAALRPSKDNALYRQTQEDNLSLLAKEQQRYQQQQQQRAGFSRTVESEEDSQLTLSTSVTDDLLDTNDLGLTEGPSVSDSLEESDGGIYMGTSTMRGGRDVVEPEPSSEPSYDR